MILGFFLSIVTISLVNHMVSLGFFTLLLGTFAMGGIISQHLDLYMF